MRDGERSATPSKKIPIFIIVLCLLLVLLCLGVLIPASGPGRVPATCKENLDMLGKAIRAYSQDYGEYYPFDERGPLHSLALLYPDYIGDPEVFLCPVARKKRSRKGVAAEFPSDTPYAGAPCSYGYTWRVDPHAPPDFVILANVPPDHARYRSGETLGHYVLYVDGGVRWAQNPRCSCNPDDNIYASEPGWSADTDAWIRQK